MQRLGTHRSLEPAGALPQQARVLDARLPLKDDEFAVAVEYLNIDSASWHQLKLETDGDPEAMADRISGIVAERGKMQNPVTGSGGMLVGKVVEVGNSRSDPQVGERIASLVSLTLTPLILDEIVGLDPASERVQVKGRAIFFGSSIYATLPEDLPDEVVLGVLDVCGAPAWMARLARPEMTVAVIGGGGKSGMLTCAQAVRSVGSSGRVLALCWPEDTTLNAKVAGAEALAVDCTDALAVGAAVGDALQRGLADLVFVCANVPGCEGGAILACKDEGRVVFFSMATSFSAAALTAEGMGKSCEMMIGNGYVPGHSDLALNLVRANPQLAERFGR